MLAEIHFDVLQQPRRSNLKVRYFEPFELTEDFIDVVILTRVKSDNIAELPRFLPHESRREGLVLFIVVHIIRAVVRVVILVEDGISDHFKKQGIWVVELLPPQRIITE